MNKKDKWLFVLKKIAEQQKRIKTLEKELSETQNIIINFISEQKEQKSGSNE